MVDIEKEVKKEEAVVKKFIKKREFWMILSAVLLIVIIALLAFNSGMSSGKAGKTLLASLNDQVGGGVTLKNISAFGNLYLAVVNYQNQEIPVYITRDGKYLVMGVQKLGASDTGKTNPNTNTPTEVPKTDKPKVELYVWGYCPYGVAAQGPLAEVAGLLGSKADFEIVPYYDGHGPYETQQNKIQLCIQKNAKSLYWKYAAKFVTDVYPKCGSSRDITCDKDESIKVMNSVGINSATIMSCVSSQGDSLFEVAAAKAQENGVSGSPTLMINGVAVNAARNAEAYKTAVCNAFVNAPAECDTSLSSTSASTGSASCG